MIALKNLSAEKTAGIFMMSAGLLLAFTGCAKLVSSFGNAPILLVHDPIFNVPYRVLFISVGGIELIVAKACFSHNNMMSKAMLVGWLAGAFLTYKIGLLWFKFPRPCGCLGQVTEMIHLNQKIANLIMNLIIFYLLCGSCAAALSARNAGSRRPPK